MANIKTWQNVLSDARFIVSDTATDPTLQRYTDQQLVDVFNRGLNELYALRPDAFYDQWDDTALDFVVPVVVIDPTLPPITNSWLNPFGPPILFYNPMVNWVVAMLEAVDDEFSEDSRSMQFYQQFKTMVTGL
jgi:hypothetical protein